MIVPVYNVAKYLNQCLDSIVNQTYQEFEVLLVDDGSTDGSAQIYKKYQQLDKRVKVIKLAANQGQSNARNVGIENATGDYLTFVDSDDWLNNDFLEQMLTPVFAHQAEIVLGNYYRYDEAQQNFLLYDPAYPAQELTQADYLRERSELRHLEFVSAWGKLFKRTLFDMPEYLRFPFGKTFEDQFLVHRLFFKAQRIWYWEKALYCWRITANSITTSPLTAAAARDDLDGYMQYVVDLSLLGKLDELAIRNYRIHLNGLQARLEAANLQQTAIYQEVEYQLHLITPNGW